MRDETGVTVRVHNPHSGNIHFGRIPDADVLLEDVIERGEENDEVGQPNAGAVLDGGLDP